MTASIPEPICIVRNGDVRIAVYRWGEDLAERPNLLLVHGTGFVLRSGRAWPNRKMARIAATLIPNAQSIHFKGAGHCVARERPEEVAAAVRGFWQDDG